MSILGRSAAIRSSVRISEQTINSAVSAYLIANPPAGYTHPETHSAGMITEETGRNFVSSTEKGNLHAPGSDNQNLSSYVQVPSLGNNKYVLSGALYETFDRLYCTETNTAVLSSGRLSLQNIWLPADITITSISFWSATTAGATLTSQLFGLFDGSYNLLRPSVNGTNSAWAANTRKTLALTSTFVTTYTGIHYLGIMVAATTVPTLKGNAAKVNGALGASAPSMGGTSNTGLTTSLPNPANAPGMVVTTIWGCVN